MTLLEARISEYNQGMIFNVLSCKTCFDHGNGFWRLMPSEKYCFSFFVSSSHKVLNIQIMERSCLSPHLYPLPAEL
jgi:hypothetical protein